ncbi:unnamed protein product [Spodoptera littoralis]|uniref:Uncharacterized protein n=1 Tax=Spodoptera littoralis TaxID=7109 RepID=A0A9P0I898_SPOLI|nr:unnamed protein product [Spodoptera littoralis]CAH1641994.1 unnamed protein product [Spodoptera littoralis]
MLSVPVQRSPSYVLRHNKMPGMLIESSERLLQGFDDIRARLTARERAAEQESKAKDKELHQLRGEVARLTKLLFEQNTPKLGARTRADGCETAPPEETAAEPRRKGGTLRTPEPIRKNSMLSDFSRARLTPVEIQGGRPRAKSVDLPAVQVPVRIKQLEERNKE